MDLNGYYDIVKNLFSGMKIIREVQVGTGDNAAKAFLFYQLSTNDGRRIATQVTVRNRRAIGRYTEAVITNTLFNIKNITPELDDICLNLSTLGEKVITIDSESSPNSLIVDTFVFLPDPDSFFVSRSDFEKAINKIPDSCIIGWKQIQELVDKYNL